MSQTSRAPTLGLGTAAQPATAPPRAPARPDPGSAPTSKAARQDEVDSAISPREALEAVREIRSRLRVTRWFPSDAPGRHGQAQRIASALIAHAVAADLDWLPSRVTLLSAADGVAALQEGRVDLLRPRWQEALAGAMDQLSHALQAVPRARHHSIFEVSGDSVSLRPEALPVPQTLIWERLGSAGPLPSPVLRELVDRLLWEIGGATGWELMRDRLGPNPFLPLLTIYEEGLYPLDLTPDAAILWAPGA